MNKACQMIWEMTFSYSYSIIENGEGILMSFLSKISIFQKRSNRIDKYEKNKYRHVKWGIL